METNLTKKRNGLAKCFGLAVSTKLCDNHVNGGSNVENKEGYNHILELVPHFTEEQNAYKNVYHSFISKQNVKTF
jgi:hypothetical protein